MNILQGIGAANGLLNGAANLVRELKRPKLSDSTFAEMLRQASAANDPAVQARKMESLATARADKVMKLHDIDGDGSLSRDESGISADEFARADLDGDGKLSTDEVKQAVLRGLNGSES